jgi:hypothetical protein
MVFTARHSKFRYFRKREWGEAFMDGDVRFKSLSYYHQIEDGAIRGDANEGSVYMQPETGLVVHNHTQGCTQVIPAGAFRSSAKSDEIFILCASNSMTDDLRARFEAECCVEILKVATLCARIEAKLPTGSTFRARAISYYSKNDENRNSLGLSRQDHIREDRLLFLARRV